MCTLDWIMVIVMLAGAIMGFLKGFLKQIISMVGLVVGLLVARALFGVVGEKLAVEVGMSATFGQILAFLLIWIIVPIGLSVIASLLTKLADAVKIGFLNRWLGSGVGLIKYALWISVVINLVEFVDGRGYLIHTESKEASVLYYPMQKFAGVFVPAFKSVTKTVGNQLKGTEHKNEYKETKE